MMVATPDATLLTYITKNGAATAEVYHSGSHSPNFLYSVVAIHFLEPVHIKLLQFYNKYVIMNA